MKDQIKLEPELTDWFDGSKFVPFHIGEYSANTLNSPLIKRWWNGKWWSHPYIDCGSKNKKRLAKMKKEVYKNAVINFQGLANNPKDKP